jgi:hypothetical protein
VFFCKSANSSFDSLDCDLPIMTVTDRIGNDKVLSDFDDDWRCLVCTILKYRLCLALRVIVRRDCLGRQSDGYS